MRTKMTLLSPRPNQMRAIGNNAIDGSGLNIEVRISRKSAPMRVALAKAVRIPARMSPATYPFRSSVIVNVTARGKRPDVIDETNAATVSENVGNKSWLASHLAYASHAAAKTARSTTFRTRLFSNMRSSLFHSAVKEHFLNERRIGVTAFNLCFDAARVSGQQEDPGTHAYGFRNRVRYKQHREL